VKPLPTPLTLARAALAALAAVLLGVACFGAAMESPVARERACCVDASTPEHAVAAVWQAASHPQAINVAGRNLQLPRAPRHRGDRPTSGAAEVEATVAAQVLACLGADTHRPFVIAAVCACPLAGHPLSLLRPPSLLAG